MDIRTYDGIIIKGVGGFYTVEAAGELFNCTARGIFRKNNISPLVGDKVKISIKNNDEKVIEEIYDRKNSLNRPPVANLDQLIILSSILEPTLNTFVIDKLTAVALHKEIEPIIVISKTDLRNADEITEIYKNAGFKTISVSCINKEGIDEVKSILKNKVSAFTGNTGVGKSSLLNLIDSELSLETGTISKKLGRGRHTTRHVELFKLPFGGYVADTPGFSSIDLFQNEPILKDDLQFCFKEFLPYLGKCKFSTCKHINDKGCAILSAMDNGEISKSRHDSYIALYNEVKDINEWEL